MAAVIREPDCSARIQRVPASQSRLPLVDSKICPPRSGGCLRTSRAGAHDPQSAAPKIFACPRQLVLRDAIRNLSVTLWWLSRLDQPQKTLIGGSRKPLHMQRNSLLGHSWL